MFSNVKFFTEAVDGVLVILKEEEDFGNCYEKNFHFIDGTFYLNTSVNDEKPNEP